MGALIAAVITTKNRVFLLEKCLLSVVNQIHQPNLKIIVSDSTEENQKIENNLASKLGFIYLVNHSHTHNYAGSLNTVIDYLIQKFFFSSQLQFQDLFFASLDDDDTWKPNYLSKIVEKLEPNTEVVVTGLWMDRGDKNFPLTIPSELNVKSFLTKNPHIQGSNTFVKLTTLLKAGAFDENMSSTTDRDVFTRIFMLNPVYIIIPEYLVDVNADDTRIRITNITEKKFEGLAKFYAKYAGIFSPNDHIDFREQIKRFGNLNFDDYLSKYQSGEDQPTLALLPSTTTTRPILAGFILTETSFGIRLVEQLLQTPGMRKVIIFLNSPRVSLDEFDDDRITLITLNQVKELNQKGYYHNFIKNRKLKNKTITDISVARTILHQHLYDAYEKEDVVWVLDDDMELKELIRLGSGFELRQLDIQRYIHHYAGKADVVVGSYSGDTPLPLVSSIRSQLLDYVYSNKFNSNIYHSQNYIKLDYYYDLAASEIGLETPLPFKGKNLDDVFSGKAYSRPLFKKSEMTFETMSRGGNTLIFNREALKIQNLSIEIDGTLGRRGDYFWVLQLKQHKFRVLGSHFCTYHNRRPVSFHYDNEMMKFEKDIIGSSFTKSFTLSSSPDHFYTHFQNIFEARLIRFIKNYYRIIGLLSFIGKNHYEMMFTEIHLQHFVKYIRHKINKNKVKPAFLQVISDQLELNQQQFMEFMKKELETKLQKKMILLGVGNEGVVFTDDVFVYKLFYDPLVDLSYLETIAPTFKNSPHLHELFFENFSGHRMIRYRFISNFKMYQGGYTNQFIKLIRFFKSIGVVPTNIKKSNFIVANKMLYYIDYGKSFEPLYDANYHKFLKRIYQLLRYHFISEGQFKEIIYLSYQGKDAHINFQFEHFLQLIEPKSKEEIHDPLILQWIQDLKPKTLLDYGAGKCKIANQIASMMDVSVYDIDQPTLQERASKSCKVLNKVTGEYDVVVTNLVLCAVDDAQVESILKEINQALPMDGHAIFSICNPFFNDVERSELRKNLSSPNYETCECYKKRTSNKALLEEYHRPYDIYQRWFLEHGFLIEKEKQTNGINFKSFNQISHHLVFQLKKIRPIQEQPISLMIKASLMDYAYLESQVKHQVLTLQQGFRFSERILVLDDMTTNRARAYAQDDAIKTDMILEKLHRDGWLDRIVRVSQHVDKLAPIYHTYFQKPSHHLYSENGQPLFASLLGFEEIKTQFVFQTDLDILFKSNSDVFMKTFEQFRSAKMLSASLSIYHGNDPIKKADVNSRIEVRNCYLDLIKLRQHLPFVNRLNDSMQFILPWHRSMDESIGLTSNLRFSDTDIWFIHPENSKKQEVNLISKARDRIEQNQSIHPVQCHQVNLMGGNQDWHDTVHHQVILFIRGYNTHPEKLNRLWDSIKKQNIQDYQIVYIDDASTNGSAAYMKWLLRHDSWFNGKGIFLFNHQNIGSLANQVYALTHIVKNPNAIIINIDNDDALLVENALETILKAYQFHQADVTVGNLLRRDKPVKHYQVVDFRWPWERNGDNIWLHPKTFKKSLFDQAVPYLKDNDGNYYEVNTDLAMMLPILYFANKPVFIDEFIYYFEPSIANQNKQGKYNESKVNEIKQHLLLKWKEIYEKNHHHHWR
jgi:hypothetical protein